MLPGERISVSHIGLCENMLEAISQPQLHGLAPTFSTEVIILLWLLITFFDISCCQKILLLFLVLFEMFSTHLSSMFSPAGEADITKYNSKCIAEEYSTVRYSIIYSFTFQ